MFLNEIYILVHSNNITQFFTYLLTFTLAVSLSLLMIKGNGRKTHILLSAPSILVTTGIIGTFVGITYGLWKFDVSAIDASIPKLLDGLKIAFVTSVLGLVYSLLLKYIYAVMPPAQNNNTKDYLDTFKEIQKSLKDKKNNTAITALEKIYSRTEDLKDSIGELDKNNSNFLKELNSSFKDFAEKVAENNTKSLIAAIEQVMKDFNAKINDQLGEDFKQLNSSVQALVTWQENYKTHVEQVEDSFNKNLQLTGEINGNIQGITDNLNQYPSINEAINETISNCNDQILKFVENGATLQNIRENTANAVDDTIESLKTLAETNTEHARELIDNSNQYSSHLQNNFNEISQYASDTTRQIKDSLEGQTDLIDQYRLKSEEKITDFSERMGSVLNDSTDSVKNMINEQIDSINHHFNEQSGKMTDAIQKFDGNFESIISKADQNFQDRLNELDKSLQEELSRSMNIISSKVASLTEKFVDDWAIIVTRSRESLNK